MSAEAGECMRDDWTRWQGHLVNNVFPLGRYIGCSDHSGVFLTKRAARGPAEVAIKLVPADRAIAESLLPRWKRAAGLTHPHLLHLYEWGGCQLEGSPYLYLVMDYADQTLAQLLQSRALTESEAREMLATVLDGLAFLHGRDLAHGQLKPANILVVGDQLKLASDTVRRVGEAGPIAHTRTPYDAPEALHGAASPAGDVWALGISLCEALTRRPPPIGEHSPRVSLPPEIAPALHELVTRCASRRPQDRPGLPELKAWLRGPEPEPPGRPGPAEPQAPKLQLAESERAAPEPMANAPAQVSAEGVGPTATSGDPSAGAPRAPPSVLGGGLLVGAVGALALAWGAWHFFEKGSTSRAAPLDPSSTAQSPTASTASASAATDVRPSAPPLSPTRAHEGVAASPSQPLREVIPDVPLGARRTIHGHIKVWVRLVVDPDGAVAAAAADRAGPSRYFERLALQAARGWTFPSIDGSSRRLMEVRFEFSRAGTRARAIPLH